jgi:hypothetical protein
MKCDENNNNIYMRIIAFRHLFRFERQWWKTIADTILSKLCKTTLPIKRVFRLQPEKSGTGLHCQGAQLSLSSALNGFTRQWWKTIADTILSKLCKAQSPIQRVFRLQLEKSGTV